MSKHQINLGRRSTKQIEHEERHSFSGYTVVLKSRGAVVGRCGLKVRQIDCAAEVELEYALARPHWGNGCATEAAKAGLDAAFGSLGPGRIAAAIYPFELPRKIGRNDQAGRRTGKVVCGSGTFS